MFDLDRWQEIYHVLRKNKLRTFLTAFGVFWGIFMLMVMLGSGAGLKNGVYRNLGDLATNSIFMWTQQTTVPYKGFPRGRTFYYENADIEALRNGIPEIKYLAPRLTAGGFGQTNTVIRGLKTGVFNIMGDYPEYYKIDPVNIINGRFINDFDINEKRKVVVVGVGVVEKLFKKEEIALNDYIQIKGVYFKIVGIFKSKRSGEQANNENQNIFMPFTTLQVTYNYGDIVGFFGITAKDDVPASVVEEKAIRILKKRHSISPDDDRAIGHFNLQREFEQMSGLFLGINSLIWVVGIGTLLAGIIGVSNIMLIVVKERTKEIGIQRAIGATPYIIISQIILESVVLTTFAGYFGLAVGVGILEFINMIMNSSGGGSDMFDNPGVDFSVAVTALTILVFSGAFAGFIPAKRAISIKPIDALRYE